MNHPDLTKIPILAFSGKAKVGKDQALSFVRDEVSLDERAVLQINFADALKEEVAKACGITVEEVDRFKDDFRPMLQWWGTDFRRKLHSDNYWLEKWKERRDWFAMPGVTKLIVCTDCRFLNEVSFLKSLGAKIVRINRPMPVTAYSNHRSETELDNYKEWDATYYNCGTLITFQYDIINIIKQLNII